MKLISALPRLTRAKSIAAGGHAVAYYYCYFTSGAETA